ncbi:MAG: cytochrome-c oxidase, cbb3-type subunit I [Phycisphaerales bacterium]|nr:cytochrome-c oxidase, cbb3-type subunit I [Phycisphaerales bacterium]
MSTTLSAAPMRSADQPHAAGGHGRGPLETFAYDDQIVRWFLAVTVLWGVVAMLAGMVVALQLVMPDLVPALLKALGLSEASAATVQQYLTFGRIRPVHTNAAIFAFVGNGMFAGVYFSTQRLCKARMWSDLLSRLHFWGWQAIIVAAAVTLPMGFTQGKEYAELEWPIDLAIAVVWLGFFGLNFFMTLLHRRERHMYVALWFYIATIVTVTVLHVFNSLAVPAAPLRSYSVYAGVQDALVQWWYGHNAVAFFLTTPILGLMYYFMPKAAERPVFSYKLSIVHFWSLVFMYIWAGPHHLHYTALPQWASTLGMLFSLMLWMPSWGGMINGLMTLRGAWQRVLTDPVLKFLTVAVTFYGMSTFEGPMLSIKAVNGLAHYTDWVIGHVHGGALGWNACLFFGVFYWLLPRLYRTNLWSTRLAEWHFWTATIGLFTYWVSMQWAGITQGLMWRAFDDSGALAFPDFVETVTKIAPMYWIRAGGGLLFFLGMLMCALNLVMTWRHRSADLSDTVARAPALGPAEPDRVYRSDLQNVIGLGRVTDQVTELTWHRRWERLPLRFTLFVALAIASASAFSLVPMFAVRSNIPTIASVTPYTPLELAGRDIYRAEGCYNCHSQMIRPIWAETRRYGEYSKPGEFVYDHPFQWGSRRIGPDLHRVGGKYSSDWQIRHLENPRSLVQGSIMPAYAHLLNTRLDFDAIPATMHAMKLVGVPYNDQQIAGAVAAAREQAGAVAAEVKAAGGYEGLDDSQAIALVAYLQRLGTDISKPPPAEGAAR